MPYSERSRERLYQCDERLQKIFLEVEKHVECSILTGHRDRGDQENAYHNGQSKLRWPNSKHNSYPSLAIDAAPWPINWQDLQRFTYFAGFVKGVAANMGIKLRWGGDWNGNFNLKDENFLDLVHFELVDP